MMQRNPAWWDQPRHNLDEVVFQQIANDSTRTAALLSGGVDAILPVPLQDVERLRRQAGVQLLERPELRTLAPGHRVACHWTEDIAAGLIGPSGQSRTG